MQIKNKNKIKNSILLSFAVFLVLSAVAYSITTEKNVLTQINNKEQKDFYLLPDLVPNQPQDVTIERTENNVLLRFTTAYSNKGDGPLEFFGISDLLTQDKNKHAVMQRIYTNDGAYKKFPVGTFTWHEEHGHYHFTDFFIYELRSEDAKMVAHTKTGFCVRDIERAKNITKPQTPKSAVYTECNTEKQGISVGWSDVYYHYFTDQWIDITDIPSGTYRLTFILNPEQTFKEKDYTNNTSSVLLSIDMENLTVSPI